MSFLKAAFWILTFLFSVWLVGLAGYTGLSLMRVADRPAEKTDVIIVLTGGKNRIETGMKLFSEGKAPQLYITGVHLDVSMQDILNRWQGAPLPECCFEIGHKATSTTENAAEAKEWLAGKDVKSIRLVTSNYHMNRALLEFHNALPGIKILAWPIEQPDITTYDEYFWHVVVIEYHKFVFRAFDMLLENAR